MRKLKYSSLDFASPGVLVMPKCSSWKSYMIVRSVRPKLFAMTATSDIIASAEFLQVERKVVPFRTPAREVTEFIRYSPS